MVAHQAPAMEQQTFFLLAIPQTIHHYIFVFLPGKHINPFHHGKGHKMHTFFIFLSCSPHRP